MTNAIFLITSDINVGFADLSKYIKRVKAKGKLPTPKNCRFNNIIILDAESQFILQSTDDKQSLIYYALKEFREETI